MYSGYVALVCTCIAIAMNLNVKRYICSNTKLILENSAHASILCAIKQIQKISSSMSEAESHKLWRGHIYKGYSFYKFMCVFVACWARVLIGLIFLSSPV